ncbi:hypothetical protein N7462_004409 [Penicillium macrosclerotiorum]|uniref:uncharacterized protein n=1 Tax=Penicillium macrosclerotiorum TaxID=303699 RepID=UPI002549193D|nr:uncharacterized protein N7462_004409 [Penicillium macrosclerotiorum]KAJ5690017.1 hypothetical protein N7462_004409 [Penicillium macrosclerotiorum]
MAAFMERDIDMSGTTSSTHRSGAVDFADWANSKILEDDDSNIFLENSATQPGVVRSEFPGNLSDVQGVERLSESANSVFNPDVIQQGDEEDHRHSYIGAPRRGKEHLENAIKQLHLEHEYTPGENAENDVQDATAEHSGMNENTDNNEWPAEDDISPEELSNAKFREAQEWYKSLESPSMEDEIIFTKAKRLEEMRLKIIESRFAFMHSEESNGQRLLTEPSGPPEPEAQLRRREGPKSRKSVNLSERELKAAMEIGLQKMIGVNKLTKMLYGLSPFEAQLIDTTEGKGRRKRKSKPQATKLTESELKSIFNPTSTIKSAQTSASMQEIPSFTQKDKSKALKELVASIPSLSKEEMVQTRSDKQNILNAIRQFDFKPRSDGKGAWKVKGLNTSLHHHQVLAVGWMRNRERSSIGPRGGLLCDAMGLGKTVTALANILDGRNGTLVDSRQRRAPTLIVVPPSLMTHWKEHINKYCDPEYFGVSDDYKSHTKWSLQNSLNKVMKCDVILTTYDQVRISYPVPNLPGGIDNEKVLDWWMESYKAAGLLHKIRWHRIVLDEGHMIKNPGTHTSIAVRALTGQFKWVLSGTPLHNCIEELFPYFNFLHVPDSVALDRFENAYRDKTERAKKKLINILRLIIHRKTHDSRLFSLPIIKLPNIIEKTVQVNLCAAERILYARILDIFVYEVNSLSSGPNFKARQWQCILTMFLKLRMFLSHLLTAQDMIQNMVEDGILDSLRPLARENSETDAASLQITKMLLRVNSGNVPQHPPIPHPAADDMVRQQPSGDREKLVQQFREVMERLHEEESWLEVDRRALCGSCENIPTQAFVTSCSHLYCEECFYSLPYNKDCIENGFRICQHCEEKITEAAHCGVFDSIDNAHTATCHEPDSPPNAGNRQPFKRKAPGISKKQSKRLRKRIKTSDMFGHGEPTEHEDPDGLSNDTDFKKDWIPIIGDITPGAKLEAVREMIRTWIQEDDKVKIVLFTQFLDTIQLLALMCSTERWGYMIISGKMSLSARDDNIEKFREVSEMKIAIASLKTGGIGLNLSVANKCILIDLWWNEAIQEQAYCRLFRIGQQREVEYIKIIANGTIDEKLLDLQKEKTKKIQEVISFKVLEDRDSIKELLRIFFDIEERGKGFKISLRTEGKP